MNWPFLIIILLIFGMLLLLVEIFIVPGFGPIGIAAVILLCLGTYFAWTKLSLLSAILITIGSILSVILSIIFLTKSSYAKKMILQKSVKTNQNLFDTLQSAKRGEEVTGQGRRDQTPAVGMVGIAKSSLRPAGIGEFGELRLNVLTDGLYIDAGTSIKIIKIEGKKVFVEK